MSSLSVSAISHPSYRIDLSRWFEYRLTFEGGEDYVDEYLIQQKDETNAEFKERKKFTPIPAIAKEAILDLQRGITQRLDDVTRDGGTPQYQAAVDGEGGGIDRDGQSMNMFIGHDVLVELLVMGRVGIYVDNFSSPGATMADGRTTPYAYVYRVEDILNWDTMHPENEGRFKMVLLRDHEISHNQAFGVSFPSKIRERLRLVWIGEDGLVRYRFMNNKLESMPLDRISSQFAVDDDGAIVTPLREIPFIMPELTGGSLLRDVASYQRTLLNVASHEAMMAMAVNDHFLAIQSDVRTDNLHWKKPETGAAVPGGQRGYIASETFGGRLNWIRARYYDSESTAPQWVSPPVESLKASHDYRSRMADEVRQMINVAVQSQTGVRSESREQRELSAEGLEAGLHFIAMKLQQAERQIAKYYSMYQRSDDVAVITYPKRFRLKREAERIADAQELKKLVDGLPGQINKKEGYKRVILQLFTGTVDSTTMAKMLRAVDQHPYIGDPEKIMDLIENALITRSRAAQSFDLPEDEVEDAMQEKIEMAREIMKAQTPPEPEMDQEERPAARGVPEADANPQSGEEERAEDEQKRGEQKAPKKEEE